MFHAQALETAGHRVAEMQAQHHLAGQIDHDQHRILKRMDDVAEDITVSTEVQAVM